MYKHHRIRRLIHNRPRLFIALLIGVVIALLLPTDWPVIARALTGWNLAAWSYLALIGWLMAHASHARVRKIAEQEDESAAAILTIISICAVLSVAAIVVELAMVKDLPAALRVGHVAFTAATVMGAWFLLGVIFTLHYAHMFYRAPCEKRPLLFPDGDIEPDYWDFLYFSFTIAVAAQTSDVAVHSRAMRKVVLAQSILSFLFNVAILGLSINIGASLVG
ncbi:MAG TPA: DUF1345 domain-containing protein [Burkholderiaceae bacterium]